MAQAGRKKRPVLVLTRPEVLDVRELVTVVEITTTVRGLAVEVGLDHREVGLKKPSVINCDGIHTVSQALLTTYVGQVSGETLSSVCSAIAYALAC